MSLLLDTSVFLRLAFDPDAVPEFIRAAVDRAEAVLLSAASVWEMAIKASIGKLTLPVPAGEYAINRAQRLGVSFLPISPQHAAAVQGLPFHHRDPVDRLLVAQAAVESLTLATTDPMMSRYDVTLLHAPKTQRRR